MTQILTIVDYKGSQVYIYGAISNENENKLTPQKWIFYYVPVMARSQNGLGDRWIWSSNTEIRLTLMLGNPEIQELARKAIVDKYDPNVSQYSKSWTVAPLMIDSLTAFIVSGRASPVAGVHPYRVVHPNSLTMTFRFQCSSKETAELIAKKVANGDYEIEIAFYFAGFKHMTTNFFSITSDQLKSVLSKTIVDGGSITAQYIHRNQASKFIENYIANVKKMIYMENINAVTASLINDLEEQFISLLQQGMNVAQQISLDAALFDQIWFPFDLNPDRLTSELSKVFTYNETETKRHNYTNTYFDFNKQNLPTSSNSNSASGGVSASFLGITIGCSGGSSSSSSNSFYDILMEINRDIFSLAEVERLISQQQTEFQWTGEKFIPKSFHVYKLLDLTDRLQVAIISKQLTADKTNGAVIRTISMINIPVDFTVEPLNNIPSGGIILWNGTEKAIPLGWEICDGTNGTPDLRDKFVIGSGSGAQTQPHTTGGPSSVVPLIAVYGAALNESQMPSHDHGGVTGPEDDKEEYYDHHSERNTRVVVTSEGRYLAHRTHDLYPTCKHAHKIRTSGQNQPHTHAATSSTIDLHPPFYALIYIMKL
ncbi:unnamed protein product [Adineta ricciae]|uniref:Uncharacterized protein n=1 Tax=Adineta ricciae TaxID=249248 RepID=A0A815G076_ADIRI|nr:unnamed protein product [Adineta ricciae]